MAQNSLELMRTLGDSWNAQDWETFEKRHARDTVVFWPGQAEPTRGRDNHKAESIEFFKTFPDNHLINHPYKVEIAQGEWTCTVADFTGTMRGPMKRSDGKLIAPTNKKFHIEFCTLEERRDRRRKTLEFGRWKRQPRRNDLGLVGESLESNSSSPQSIAH
jgi:hypothetical protein